MSFHLAVRPVKTVVIPEQRRDEVCFADRASVPGGSPGVLGLPVDRRV